MIAAGKGAMVLIGSIDGFMAEQGLAAYCATKGAILQFSKVLAVDHARQGIRVNCVCPGVIDTPLLGPAHGVEAVTNMLAKGHLLNRVGAANEVAQLVSFLLSERAGFITGAAYPIDGGMTATIGGTVGEMDENKKQAFENFMDGLPGDE